MKPNTLPFFVAVFVITWLLQLPALLVSYGVIAGPVEKFLPLLGLSALGPLFAGTLAAYWESGRAGIRALFRPLRIWRVHPGFYVFALLSSGGIFVAGMAVYTLVSGRDAGPWFYVPKEAPALLALVFFPFGEEVGWRGFAQPRLQQRYGPVVASAIIGIFWGLWHLPMFQISGVPLWLMVVMLPFFISGSMVFTWLYTRTRGSLLLAVLMHVGAHLNNSNKALPGNVTPVFVHTAAFCAAALGLYLLDRKVFQTKTPDAQKLR